MSFLFSFFGLCDEEGEEGEDGGGGWWGGLLRTFVGGRNMCELGEEEEEGAQMVDPCWTQ